MLYNKCHGWDGKETEAILVDHKVMWYTPLILTYASKLHR